MLSYATREQVSSSLEIMSTSRSNREIDRALVAARFAVEGQLRRRFYPERKTIRFDWPNYALSPPWTLRLDGGIEAVSLVALSAGGTDILSGAFLRRDDNLDEPPYNMIQIDTSTDYAFQSGDTFQRAVSATIVTGYSATDSTVASCVLGGDINSSVTTVVLNPTSGIYDVGVGSLILIDDEYLSVRERRMSDTGQNLQSNMDDLNSDVIVDVTDASGFAVGETILLGAERMCIVDIVGNNLIVDRAWDGTVLAEHTAPEDVYALRTFTVQRGVLGTTAAAHTTSDVVSTHQYPGLVNQLCEAEATVFLAQQTSGWARQAGSGATARESAGQGIVDIRNLAIAAHGRLSRSGAV